MRVCRNDPRSDPGSQPEEALPRTCCGNVSRHLRLHTELTRYQFTLHVKSYISKFFITLVVALD